MGMESRRKALFEAENLKSGQATHRGFASLKTRARIKAGYRNSIDENEKRAWRVIYLGRG